jgi:hypothetical protein
VKGRWEEAFERENRKAYERRRDEMIEEALRDGIRWLTLPLPGGGEGSGSTCGCIGYSALR